MSGLKSFQNQDPVRGQKMMRARVAAQFVTLICFVGYMGTSEADFRIMPFYQDNKKQQQQQQEQQNLSSNNNASSAPDGEGA